MFLLTDDELQAAYDVICHHGYSTMLPPPPEWQAVAESWADIKTYLSQKDLDTYKPYKPLRVFAPKSRSNIRVVHLLHPEDLIIYTALVIIIKDDIEKARSSKQSKRVFSYRTNIGVKNRLYDTRGSFNKYLTQLSNKANKASTKFVGIADIADFYPRIYQHRLENVIASEASSQRGVDVARVLVKKLISKLMGGNSYGIPVGPYASRILGEAVLIDVDAYLHSIGVDFVRWVDDYNIFSKSEYLAQSHLFKAAEWLYTQHGLTLQSSKTKILPVERYTSEVLAEPGEELTDRDAVIAILKQTGDQIYDDEIVDGEEEIDDELVGALLEQLQGYDLLGMFEESISDQALVDYEIVKYVLTRLPRLQDADGELKENLLKLVIENADLLYPAAEYVADYILSFDAVEKKDRKKIGNKILNPLKSKNNKPPDYYAMWILYIFSTSPDWNHASSIAKIYQNSTSEVVKRYAALALAVCGSRTEALIVKDDFPSASDMLRLAILSATNKLGNDERKHWKLAHQVNGIVEKLV